MAAAAQAVKAQRQAAAAEADALLVLKRNPNYRGEPYPCEGSEKDRAAGLLDDCGKKTPFVDTIVLSMEKEAVPQETRAAYS